MMNRKIKEGGEIGENKEKSESGEKEREKGKKDIFPLCTEKGG